MPFPNTKPQNPSEVYKTGSLQETPQYTWNTADILGRGATACVYFGRNKTNGDVCAVKVFYDREWRHQIATRQREIETLSSLDHQNIVKLLALEKENASGNVVLVMEYCSGGSVFNMLETPQHSLGFAEDEFRLFLTHICSGLNYLRIKGYIHRDIKPGNIMRYIAMDGRSVYKLTDFGAARELQDDETFNSIYGTEEYLYPMMYERAVLRMPGAGNSTFNICVDIWSLGVTIYHVATGQLPFQPFGGRTNSSTMFEITSKKPSGVISGTQKVQNGPISWNTKLPDTCTLSDQLQEIVVVILGGLMEVNPSRMWTFETFFRHVGQLDRMLIVKVFFCGTGQLIHLYVEQTDNVTRIQEKLAMETDIPAVNQLLLYQDKDIRDSMDTMTPARMFHKSFFKEILFLFNRTSMETYTILWKELLRFPEILGYENLDADAQCSKKATSIAYHYHMKVQETIEKQRLLNKAEQSYRKYIKSSVRQFELILPEISCTLQETERRLRSFQSHMNVFQTLFQTVCNLIEDDVVILTDHSNHGQINETVCQIDEYVKDMSLKKFHEKIMTRLNEINVYLEVLSRKMADQETERLKMSHGCQEEDNCLSKAEHLRTLIANIALTMAKHKKYRDLHSHESFIHKCEKEKLQEYTVNIWSLTKEHCGRNLVDMHRNVIEEIGKWSRHLVRTTKVEQNIFSVKESSAQLSARLEENEARFSSMVVNITTFIKSSVSRPMESSIRETSVVSYNSGSNRSIPVGAENQVQHDEEKDQNTRDEESWKTIPEGSTNGYEKSANSNIRSELSSHNHLADQSTSNNLNGATKSSKVKISSVEGLKHKLQRTEMLSLLTEQLGSLQQDSEELKRLVAENSLMMEKFLNETSNLHIEGSLDSDQRRFIPDDT